MRKYIIPLSLVALAIGLVSFKNYNFKQSLLVEKNQQTGYEQRANLSIVYSSTDIKNFDLVINNNDTAYSVLKNTAEKEKINFEYQQYDFGVFVKKIGEFKSSAKKSWIYYVNGESGQIAADQYKLKNNDKVEWKYETPK